MWWDKDKVYEIAKWVGNEEKEKLKHTKPGKVVEVEDITKYIHSISPSEKPFISNPGAIMGGPTRELDPHKQAQLESAKILDKLKLFEDTCAILIDDNKELHNRVKSLEYAMDKKVLGK